MATKKRIRRADTGPNVVSIGAGFEEQNAQGILGVQPITDSLVPLVGGQTVRILRPTPGNVVWGEYEGQLFFTASTDSIIGWELAVSGDEGATWQPIGDATLTYPATGDGIGGFLDRIEVLRFAYEIAADDIVEKGPTLILRGQLRFFAGMPDVVTLDQGLLRLRELQPAAVAA